MNEYENIDEQVAVLVGFDKDKKMTIRPFVLRWRERDYIISDVAHYYRYKEGRKTIHVMGVTDGVNFFELKCESENMTWMLGRVSDNEVH